MSVEPDSTDPGLNALESALGALVPARSRMDRDRVMYRAGEASASARARRRGDWIWRAAAAGLALVVVGEGALLVQRSAPQVIEKRVVVHVPAPAPMAPPAERVATVEEPQPTGSLPAFGQTEYERLTAQVLRYGLDGLPASPSASWSSSEPASSPASSGSLLNEELRRIREPGDPS